MNVFRLLILPMALTVLGLSSGCSISVSGGVGVSCRSDLDCASGDFCDYASGLCAQDGTIVVGGYCNDDRDCASGDACDPQSGACVAIIQADIHTIAIGSQCQYDEECMPGDACDTSGLCVADSYQPASENTGAPCYEDADCTSNYCDIHSATCV
jgi:Cys-rich repeat protein